MFNVRKGITPVIAIVLLILITLGAVGVVWTQFQGILNFGEEASSQQQAMSTEITIESVYKDGDDDMAITWRNPNDRTLNTSNFRIGFSTSSEASMTTADIFTANTQFATGTDATCFDDGDSKLVEPGNSSTCKTGIDWTPEKPIDMYVKIAMKGADKTFSHHCETATTSDFSC